ncbi:uncharacterized protein LOC106648625 [Trichogramma pretiosum]|uniref:uncharacterized protein LOC106648625 n=1 Tax=Trichogramma pretiosum TaxID=7493 RepID=UPI0006C9AF03|nr:uncharacterized protein LOC106648625 [Trichogramma pretiosum]
MLAWYSKLMHHISRIAVDELKSLPDTVNWDSPEERHEFLRRLYPLVRNWKVHLPNLREVFSPEQIDRLLLDAVDYWAGRDDVHRGVRFIKFVARTGYRDKPVDVDEATGKPGSCRSTALLRAVRCGWHYEWDSLVRDLFKIYNRFDVNYSDESGLTHFHVACKFGCYNVVEKYLNLGQDPDLAVPETGDSPLHLAVARGHKQVADLLLKAGARPSPTNDRGLTPLHLICRKMYDDDLMEVFLKLKADERLDVNIQDKSGRTPLQWAVVNLLPDLVTALLDLGADLASFVFPAPAHFDERHGPDSTDCWADWRLRVASDAIEVVERLETRGYGLDRSDALSIMKVFASHELFDSRENVEFWRRDEETARLSERIVVRPDLGLYSLIRLQPEKARKLMAYSDYFALARSRTLWKLPEALRRSCVANLCEKLSRRFFQRWALESFLELTQHRLPILCCDMIIDNLVNADLFGVCAAAETIATEQQQKQSRSSTWYSSVYQGKEVQELQCTRLNE